MQILILYILFSKNEFIHFTVFLRISWSALLKPPPGSLGTGKVSAKKREQESKRETEREREGEREQKSNSFALLSLVPSEERGGRI